MRSRRGQPFTDIDGDAVDRRARRRRPRRVAEQGRSARDGPARPRLDAEHQPHRLLRRRGERLVRPRPASTSRSCPTPARRPRRSSPPARPSAASASRTPSRSPPRPGRRSSRSWPSSSTRPRRSRSSPRPTSPGRRTSTGGPTRASATPTRSRRSRASSRPTAGPATFKTVTLDTAAYDALYAKRADFVITFAAWEGIEAKRARHRAADLQVRRLRLPGLLPGRPRVRQPLAGLASRSRARVRRRDGPRVRARRGRPREGRRAAGRPEPGRLRWQPGAPRSRARSSWRRAATFATRTAPSVARRWPSGRATRASCSTRGCWPGRTASRSPTAPDYQALFTNDFLP